MSLFCAQANQGHASLSRQFKYEIEWISERNYSPGTMIELRVQSLGAIISWLFMKWYFDKGSIIYTYPVPPAVTSDDAFSNQTNTVVRAMLRYGVRKGESSTFTVYAIPHIHADVNARISLWANDTKFITADSDSVFEEEHKFVMADNDSVFEKEPGEVVLYCNPGPVERLQLYSRPAARAGKVRVAIVPEDKYGNPTSFAKPIKAELHWGSAVQEVELSSVMILYLPALDTVSCAKLVVPMSALSPDEDIANADIKDGQLIIQGNPVIVDSEWLPSFGEFHWHTELSPDGERPLSEGFHYAYNVLNLDCACSSDHNTQGEKWR